MNHQKPNLMENPWDAIQGMGGNPVVVTVAAAIFAAGLVCEIVIAVRLLRGGTAGAMQRLSQVGLKPWGLGEVGLITVVLCGLMCVGSLALSAIEHYNHVEPDDFKRVQLFTSILLIDGLGLLAIILLLYVERVGLGEAFGMRARTIFLSFGLGIVCLLATVPPVWVMAGISEQLCQRFHISVEPQDMAQLFLQNGTIGTRIAIAFTAVVLAPLFEEMFFRGLTYPALKQKIGWLPALLLTSLLFGAIHFHVPSFLPLCVLAAGLTLAYEVTGNLAVPIVMHSLFNLMSLLVMAMVPT